MSILQEALGGDHPEDDPKVWSVLGAVLVLGSRIVACCDDGKTITWDLPEDYSISTRGNTQKSVWTTASEYLANIIIGHQLSVSPDLSNIATVVADSYKQAVDLQLYNMNTGECLVVIYIGNIIVMSPSNIYGFGDQLWSILQMDLKFGILQMKMVISGGNLSRTVNLTLLDWIILSQLSAHLENFPGIPLMTTKLWMMGGYSTPARSNSYGCLPISGGMSRQGSGVDSFLHYYVKKYQRLLFWR